MKTASEVIKEVRLQKKISLVRLEKETKIKKEFLQAVEAGEWDKLPDFPVLTGFIKNIADFLGINQNQIMAMFRRDYPPKKLFINPKPDLSDKFTWTPRLTFYLGAGLIIIFTLGYLVFQYTRFVTPPSLSVLIPEEGSTVNSSLVKVIGKTDPDASVKVNNQPALVDEDGSFTAEIQIHEGTMEIVIKAISRTGKETVVRRTIKPALN